MTARTRALFDAAMRVIEAQEALGVAEVGLAKLLGIDVAEMRARRAAAVLSAWGAGAGGRARAHNLTPERRSTLARLAAEARWAKARAPSP